MNFIKAIVAAGLVAASTSAYAADRMSGPGETGGESGAISWHAFDQKPASMTVKNMFHQR